MRDTTANSADVNNVCEGFVVINSVPVSVKTWGKWIHDSLEDVREIILLSPGMIAGIPSIYSGFLTDLYNNLDRQIPIWVVGHPGHDESKAMKIPPLQGNEHLYDIHGQIQSKAEFIRKYVPSHVKVHLVGHSLGTFTTTQLLKDKEIKERAQKCYLIFPTIRGRADGKNMNCTIAEGFIWFYNYFGFLLRFLCKIPDPIKSILFKVFCFLTSSSTDLLEGFLRVSKPDILDKNVHLIKTSIRFIRFMETDIELLEENKKLIKLYYGANDGWAPLEFYRELKMSIPDIDAEIDTYGIEHGILWRSSSIMAKIISEMVKNNKIV
ncbi:C2orf43.2 family protein [Megaselia abdita]